MSVRLETIVMEPMLGRTVAPNPRWQMGRRLPGTGPARRKIAVTASKRARCSHFVGKQGGANRVLFVGAERPDEFADAARLARQGHDVLVVNPRETDAAKSFRQAGGQFVRTRIEALPSLCRS